MSSFNYGFKVWGYKVKKNDNDNDEEEIYTNQKKCIIIDEIRENEVYYRKKNKG